MMKKMTLAIALTCVAALAFSQVTFKEVWEFSKTKTNLPDYIGSGHVCRSMAVGNVDGTDLVAVASRVGGVPNIVLLAAATGTETGKLNMTGVDASGHPSFPINTVEISADGVILGSNLAALAGHHFKIYAWGKTDAEPLVLLDYPAVAQERFGDSFMVLGNVKDGSAKLYAVCSDKKNPHVMILPMVKSGANWVFDLAKRENYKLPYSAVPASLDKLPNGNFIFNKPGNALTELKPNHAKKGMEVVDGHELPASAMSTYVSGPIHVATKGNDMYVAALGYTAELHCGVVAKITDNDWAKAVGVAKTPHLNKGDTNAGGTGRVRAREEGGKLYLYVLETNNGIGKYEMVFGGTSLDKVAYSVAFEQTAGRLTVKGVEASSIELFNLLGQPVRAARMSNELNLSGLKGLFLVQVRVNGRPVKSEKVIVR